MSDWRRQRSEERIRRLISNVPRGSVDVRQFTASFAAVRRAQIEEKKRSLPSASEDLIFNIKPSEALLVDGVHLYVQLIDYHQQMIDARNETDAGHRRLLEMLHVHYTACDVVAEEFEAQRVDFHGPRMHAVVITPVDDERERIARAYQFADALKRTIEEIGRTLSGGTYRTRVRIGMDSGRAVAVNGGRGNEQEPLFLGSPANYAAKLAEGDTEGIFPSSRIRRQIGSPLHLSDLATERTYALSAQQAQAPVHDRDLVTTAAIVDTAVQRVRARFGDGLEMPDFVFHYHPPPLRSIDFAALSPSNAIRMGMLSIFGDLDGFTRYVDECIAGRMVSDMVTNLHVIRGELAACLQEDFGGRKIRFIGDCIQGVLADGTKSKIDPQASVRSAVAAAAGMRSSFELCREMLAGVRRLDLAIGLEFGVSPVSRVGLRGERSVRCCVGKAVSASEALQRSCDENIATQFGSKALTRLGERAREQASAAVKRVFDMNGFVAGLDYASFVGHVDAPPIVRSGLVVREVRPYLN